MDHTDRVLHTAYTLSWLPGESKSKIQASILKHQKITVAQIGKAKSVLWTYDFQYKKNIIFLFGASKNVIWASVLFYIKFVLYLPEWASGDKSFLYHSYQDCPIDLNIWHSVPFHDHEIVPPTIS